MERFKNYVTLITAFILTGSVFMSILPESSHKSTVKFIISAILMIFVLSPISELKKIDIKSYENEYTSNNDTYEEYGEYAAEKVKQSVYMAVADFAQKKNISIADTEVTTENGKIKYIVTDKNLAAYKTEIADILGIPQEYIKTSE